MSNVQRPKNDYAQVPWSALYDPTLSLKAKGLYAYIFAKPDNWSFSIPRMAKEMKDGKDSLTNTVKELEEKGYLHRHKKWTGGKDYHLLITPSTTICTICAKPSAENPHQGDSNGSSTPKEPSAENPHQGTTNGLEPSAGKPTVVKTHVGKTRTIIKKEYIERKNNKKEILSLSSENEFSHGNEINEILGSFKNINPPKYQSFFANKTQRNAVDRLLKVMPKEKILEAMRFLEERLTAGDQFVPQIATPIELENKMAKLRNHYVKVKKEKGNKKIGFINFNFAV